MRYIGALGAALLAAGTIGSITPYAPITASNGVAIFGALLLGYVVGEAVSILERRVKMNTQREGR